MLVSSQCSSPFLSSSLLWKGPNSEIKIQKKKQTSSQIVIHYVKSYQFDLRSLYIIRFKNVATFLKYTVKTWSSSVICNYITSKLRALSTNSCSATTVFFLVWYKQSVFEYTLNVNNKLKNDSHYSAFIHVFSSSKRSKH